MFKKEVVLILLIILASSVLAQTGGTNATPVQSGSTTNPTAIIDKAYQCLRTQIDNKVQNEISLQEAVFGVLALGSNSKLVSAIESKIVEANHWAETPSPIKDTSQVLLAYKRIGKNTDTIFNWLKSNEKTATDLNWYLQIDISNHLASSCTITYDSVPKTVSINEDMTISGNAGSCLTSAQGGFWLKVDNSCIDKNYTISCNKDFTTSTLYQRTGSTTMFVSPTAHSSASDGTTIEKFNSKCFSTDSASCDYEGTLWATLALDSLNKDIPSYLPYLLALSESNQRHLPSAVLYSLTNGQDQYSQLVQLQQESKYWIAPNTQNNKYYDSSLALFALQGATSTELTSSKNYFLSIVTPDGCWNDNNLRDTGFLLYAGWPRAVSSTGGSSQTCASVGKYCVSSVLVCRNDLNGTVSEQNTCVTGGVCCSNAPTLTTCSAQNGVICSSDKTCSGQKSPSSDGSCCLSTCDDLPSSDACTVAGNSCETSCISGETQTTDACSESSKVCCKSTETNEESGTNWVLWIILLIILIGAVVAGIFYKDKIKLFLFKRSQQNSSSGYQQGIPPGGRPPFPPARGPVPMRAPPRFIPSGNMPPARRPGQSSSDKEMDETMRKLKEMGR